tara:strand:+ start:59582 stop:59821 length:240 start_codon:yes stop_codon:yes gene_type:complete
MANKYPQEQKRVVEEITTSTQKKCTHPQRQRRQESAKKCAEARAKRSDKQQLAHLDKLLGKNKGAKKERARLKARIAKK